MTPPRFHCPVPLASGMRLTLPAEAAHHAVRVLRMAAGDPLLLFDGRGGEFLAHVQHIERGQVMVAVEGETGCDRESPLAIVLAQGISSGERMDYTLQKAVELGVAEIWPLTTERSVVRLSGERAEKRRAHWQRVVIAACEQSGRSRVPPVQPVGDFPAWLAGRTGGECRILLTPEGQRRLVDLPRPAAPVVLLIGPEGGLAPQEQAMATGRGFAAVRLGPRILRTETAALAAMAAMHALWGDF